MKINISYPHGFARHCISAFFIIGLLCGGITASANDYSPQASITGQPSPKTVCAGSTTTFSVTATGGPGLTYSWEVSTNGGSSYTAIAASANYSGFKSATLTVSNIPAGFTGYKFHCVVTDGTPATSNPATLTVNPLPDAQTVNQGKTVCQSGATALTASDGTGYTYTWQVSTDNGTSWSTLGNAAPYSDATTKNLQITGATSSMSDYLYRSITSNGTCSVTSAIDTLYVYQPTVTTTASDISFCTGSTVTLPVTASSPLALTYQWQVRSSSSTYTNLANDATYSGTASNTLTVANTPASLDGAGYNIIVTDAKGCFASQNFTLHKYAAVVLGTAPGDTSLCAGTRLLLRVTGSNVNSYQWQTDNGTNGASWTTVSTSSIYNLAAASVTTALNGYKYKAVLSDVCAGTVSKQLTLTVRRSGTWLGYKDTKWEEPLNWCGGVPDNTIDVLVPNWPTNMPIISDATVTAFYKSLEIENAARLTISGGVVNNMTGPFNIQGTVAYTAVVDQNVFPANHGSLEINGSGNKNLLSNVDITKNLVLGGNAKLVTSSNIITMKNNSNPIVAAAFTDAATSWVVTGNGNTGPGNTGLGGVRIEQVDAADGAVLYPVGPTPAAYNPIQLTNAGVVDNFTVAVNDQVIPGGLYSNGINRTWLVSEAVPGGSNVTLSMKWQQQEEQSMFLRGQTQIIRSNGTQLVESTTAAPASGIGPSFARAGGSFATLTQFSVASNVSLLPIGLQSFSVQKTGNTAATLTWKMDAQDNDWYFTVQRSTDGTHFTGIAQVNAEAGKTVYSFLDNTLTTGTVYYRLQLSGQGNEARYSTIQSVAWGNNAFTQLRPSITNGSSTQVYLNIDQPSVYTIFLTDVAGRIYWKQSASYNKGSYQVPVWLGSLTKGVYYVHVNDGKGNAQVLTLVKQ